MAITATINFRDSFNRLTRKKVETDDTVLATAETHVGALVTALLAVSDLAVESVEYHSVNLSQAAAGEASSNVDVGATFKCALSGGGYASYKIPGIALSYVGPNGVIDLTDEDIAAVFALMLSAGHIRISDGESISSVIAGQLDK
jgi:hypothetical protein